MLPSPSKLTRREAPSSASRRSVILLNLWFVLGCASPALSASTVAIGSTLEPRVLEEDLTAIGSESSVNSRPRNSLRVPALLEGPVTDGSSGMRVSETYLISMRGYYGGGLDLTGGLVLLEGEVRLPAGFSLGGSAGFYSYHWEQTVGRRVASDGGGHDIVEKEDGIGAGVTTDLRWYFSGDAFHGLHIGLGGGAYYGRWEWKQDGSAFGSDEDGDGAAFDLHTSLGYLLPVGGSFYVGPEAILGYWFVIQDHPGPGSLGLFAGIGLRAGFAF